MCVATQPHQVVYLRRYAVELALARRRLLAEYHGTETRFSKSLMK